MQSETTTRASGADMVQLDEGATNLGALATESAPSNGEGPAQATEDVVVVRDDMVILENFVERNPDVVELISRADDQAAATHRLLGVGAQAAKLVETDTSTQVMEGRIDELVGHVDSQFGEFVEIVGSLVEAETGLLPAAFADYRKELEDMFGEAVDPDKKSSMVSALDEWFTDAVSKAVGNMKEVLSLDDEDSELSKLREDLKGTITSQTTKLGGEIQGVRDLVTGAAGIAAEREKGTAKGREYEDQVNEEASRLAVPYRDLVEDVGDVYGSAGTKGGDSVVTLSAEDTFGQVGRIAFESKNQSLGIRETFDEIEAAMENRDAQVGVAVFASQAQAPGVVPFQEYGTKAVVVFDPEEGAQALQLAYMWARTKVRQELAPNADVDLDMARVSALIDEARQGLALVRTIKGNHTKAKKEIDKAIGGLDDLVDKVQEALDKLADELTSNGESE